MLQGETGVITSHRLAFSYRTCTVFAHQLKCIGAPEQQRRKSDGGFSLFVTAVWCVCSSPASGSALMPTHHHLPEIKTSWVWRVEQEEIETEGGDQGGFEGVGWRQEQEEVWIGREREEERSAPELVLCWIQLFSLLTLSNSFTTTRSSAVHYIRLLLKLLFYREKTGLNLNDSSGHQPNIIKPLPLVWLWYWW